MATPLFFPDDAFFCEPGLLVGPLLLDVPWIFSFDVDLSMARAAVLLGLEVELLIAMECVDKFVCDDLLREFDSLCVEEEGFA
ncbi:hypothetical protein HBI56_147030 [Parastagonospora nodorum]|uniref:Uncharacterized protein n=2 Tax=Phaeosphaeria nodorum (strain SN15 / ATCC MYA-4574 / FGSC 10173) TaxID=321614 RepID=A0A7U2NQP8_PHANO|nr:hypothetical protein SNOG_12620 [Parastagonospora nodorum SN15]KAH3923417.1 hypothetical protein HBH54_210130 [Parastagonospora nodorum]EAT79918.1 hypothetical protein SNOG_12620 [Parastagonospora nodorum SN15]KAH3952036.1 hypothetical protein HBH53_050300 [Parastagonospora nodorum]KAH4023863.1 hypothetical protein HBI09_165100 [Parastagonospora nodorum]KAH4045727.1 hypothetical protein HBH49_194570 [Parastagonospora nodorum]